MIQQLKESRDVGGKEELGEGVLFEQTNIGCDSFGREVLNKFLSIQQQQHRAKQLSSTDGR